MPALSLRFLYIFCNDLAAMRHFYSDLLQLDEIYHAPGEEGSLGYKCDQLQFTIFATARPLPVLTGWHWQPGWRRGAVEGTSWSVECETEGDFRGAIHRLKAAGVPSYFEAPQWLGYWSFPVKDPLGNTVEITLPAESEPEDKQWRNEAP
jgi:catechol 2,3-dioxygenase-like lactoylglutathione lyase family enzyme